MSIMQWLRPKTSADTQSRIDQLVKVELPDADRACQRALDAEDDSAWLDADKQRSDLQIELRRLRDLHPSQIERERRPMAPIVNVEPPRPYKPERFEPVLTAPPPFGGSDLRQRFDEPDTHFHDRRRGIVGWRHCPEEGDPNVPYQGTPRWVTPEQRPDLVLQLELMGKSNGR